MRVAVLGVGLIGGSIGLAARRRLGAEVAGYDPSGGTLERALGLGAIDRAAKSVAAAAEGADAVFCAAPVGALPALCLDALAAGGDETVVTDVGSTKRGLVEAVAGHAESRRFVGGHPLAGAETAGVESARVDLFEGARWYLTPTERTEGVLFDRLHRLLADIGARPQAIDPAEHDRIMATVSHLPHVIANVLASRARETLTTGERRPEVGRSFRDTTRVAGANPPMWEDIFNANAATVADEIEAVVGRLEDAAALLRSGEGERIRGWQEAALEDRRVLEQAEHPGGELSELRIAVENRPGTVAEIALALGRAGVNIEDMSLFPAPDRRTGAISLWIAGREEAERAGTIVAGLGHSVSVVTGGA
jgi:prephenate dehydrogenase